MKFTPIFVMTLSTVLLSSACGGGGNNTSSSTPPSGAVPPSPTPAPSSKTECAMIPEAGQTKPAGWDDAVDFSATQTLRKNVMGNIEGEIRFLQSNLVYPKRNNAESRPHLTAHRSALLLYRPTLDNLSGLSIRITRANGESVDIALSHPFDLAKSDQGSARATDTVVFSKCSWSATVPWQYIEPGMSLTLTAASGETGEIRNTGFEFGPPADIILQSLDIGILTEPSNNPNIHLWTDTNQGERNRLVNDYFQKIPVSQITSAEYAPVYIPEVLLVNGTRYTEKSADTTFDPYEGDLIDLLGRDVFAQGIVRANSGSLYSQPLDFSGDGFFNSVTRPLRMTTLTTMVGNYTNASSGYAQIQVHGYHMAKNGIYLADTKGNELTHEMGHELRIKGHYPGDIESIHSLDSGWHYDLVKQRTIGNLRWHQRGTVEIPSGHSRAAFDPTGHAYNTDAMGGAEVSGTVSELTQHTPFSAKIIQEELTRTAGRISPSNSENFERWDQSSQKYVDWNPDVPMPDKTGIPVTTLVGLFHPSRADGIIYPPMYSNWGNVFSKQKVEMTDPNTSDQCILRLSESNGANTDYRLTNEITSSRLYYNKFHLNLDSARDWQDATLMCRGNDHASAYKVLSSIALPQAPTIRPAITVGREKGFAAEKASGSESVEKVSLKFSPNTNEIPSVLAQHLKANTPLDISAPR